MARTEQQSNEKYGGRWFWRYASPAAFFPLAGRIEALCWVLAIVLSAIGLYLGFFVAPTDAQQGEVYRVIFIHVPAAWMAMVIYLAMAFWSLLGLVLGTRLDIGEDDDEDLLDPADPATQERMIYHWLTGVLALLVDASAL